MSDMTVRRVRFEDSDLVIEITYDGLEPVTARAIGNVSGFGSSPDTDRAVAFVLNQAVNAYKNNSRADRNKENATKPRKGRLFKPTPEEVVEAMKAMKMVNSRGEIPVSAYRDELLKELKKSYPQTNMDALDRRLTKAREQRLLKPI